MDGRPALFEPVHGAAFDTAGRGAVDAQSFILTASMMMPAWIERRSGGANRHAVRGAVAAGASAADMGDRCRPQDSRRRHPGSRRIGGG